MAKVLLIMEQCNPEWVSVPLVGFNFYRVIRKRVEATLVTHERNRNALEKVREGHEIVYISEDPKTRSYYRLTGRLTSRGAVNWPLQHALSYPIYNEFNKKVYRLYHQRVERKEFDVVHALTPMLPRYPVKMINACRETPFVLGPVNGGIPFPKSFEAVGRQEFSHFNFLRLFSRLLPGYTRTYQNADRVLSGSSYTLEMIRERFCLSPDRIQLFFENGIPKSFFGESKKSRTGKGHIRLLFVGRLVPYKGADMVIDALSRVEGATLKKIRFSIVGDGPERQSLEKQSRDLGLEDVVCFAGWVDQKETARFYRESDMFCFPSVREFGGAVVLEAMASGLPCVVVDHGGIGEYVTDETGFKIAPRSRDYITEELARKIQTLVHKKTLYEAMSKKALERAGEFEWERKGDDMVSVYEAVIRERNVS